MPWHGPQPGNEFPSLGWQLIEAWSELFPSPRNESESFVLTDEQARTVVAWYSIHPVTGKFIYRRGCSRRAKGSGKSPIEAAKCISELALPVRFDGWDAHGEPVARPWGTKDDPPPWVQIASLSEDQDENTYAPLHFFLTANDGRLADELGVDAGLTRCFLRRRPDAKLEPVTSRAGSREGQPITYATLDETGLMTPQNGGVKLARTIRRNVGKMGGRAYETTNGFVPGEASVAEGTHKAWEKGTEGIFYDAVEAPAQVDGVDIDLDASDEILKRALQVAYGDAWWVDLDRIVRDIRDPDMPWEDAQRFFLNWNRSGGGAVIDIKAWEALADPSRTGAAGEDVGLGFDGSISDDLTVLYGCTRHGFVFEIASWQRPPNAPPGWRIPRLEVDAAVREAFAKYRVGRMLCDPAKWYTEIETWEALFNVDGEEPRVVVLDTNSAARFAPACDRFVTGVREKFLSHNGDPALTQHLAACAKRKVRLADDEHDGRTRFVVVKCDTRKIDRAVAAILAVEAAMTMPSLAPEAVVNLW